MANLKQEIYNHLATDSSIIAILYDGSLNIFEETLEEKSNSIKKHKLDIKIKVDKDNDKLNPIFDLQTIYITAVSQRPLQTYVHGEAIKNSIYNMIYYEPVFDASTAGNTWIDVVDVSLFDGSIYTDASMYIPENTVRNIRLENNICSYDPSLNLHILDVRFWFLGNIEKVKK